MISQSLTIASLIVLVAAGPAAGGFQAQGDPDRRKERPQLSLRASPMFGFPPLKSVLTAELTGGANDFEDYYCAKVEWEWGDGTTSSASYDCDPYVPGKSEIRRRFTTDHTFREPGRFEVSFRLKQGSKIVGSVKVTITVTD